MNSIYLICTQNPPRQRRCTIYLLVASVSKPPSDTFYHRDVMRNSRISRAVIVPLMWIIMISASSIAKSIRVHLWRLFHSISFALQFPLWVVSLLLLLVHFHLQCIFPIQVVTTLQTSTGVAAINPVARLEHLHSVG